MGYKIRKIATASTWRQMFAVFVDERQVVIFAQAADGRWRVIDHIGWYLTRRAARAEALRISGIQENPKVPKAFYE